jgi:integrase
MTADDDNADDHQPATAAAGGNDETAIVPPTTLRHFRGTPIAVIAAWLGHASAAFTMATYAHSQDEALKAAASSFGRVVTFSDTETRPGSGR